MGSEMCIRDRSRIVCCMANFDGLTFAANQISAWRSTLLLGSSSNVLGLNLTDWRIECINLVKRYLQAIKIHFELFVLTHIRERTMADSLIDKNPKYSATVFTSTRDSVRICWNNLK